jgi:sulfoxide reductase heme-binding subunit YedZ
MSSVANAPVWYLMRASGVVSLLLLTGVLALGTATRMRTRLGTLPGFATPALHRSLALLSLVFLGVHVATALADPYAKVRLVDAVVPFTAHASALALGLGVLSLDLMAAVIVTSLLRRHVGLRAWRAVHWVAYAAWPLAILHGIAQGSDAGTPWLRAVDGACLAVAIGCIAARLRWPRMGGSVVEPSAR